MSRRNVVKGVLWLLTGMAMVVAVSRFTRGLGATTALTDSTPWGFWIGFDVISGVALAAGGFVLAAIVYIFRLEKFHALVRPAVLTAFLGYLAVAIGLTFDLGLPWNIWHPMIYWQYHSVLFEVAMCVMLYLTVLALEFAPVMLEHKLAQWKPLQLIYKLLKLFTIPLVIVGIMLSTLHQSSLGSLFVIMPYRTHPLWYSPGLGLPLNFFISAIGLGFMMVMLEHFVSGWVYKHEPKVELLSTLGGAAGIVLGLYVVVRVGDLALRGVLPGALDGSWQSILFLVELGISAVIPAVLMAFPRVRRSAQGLFAASLMVVLGMILYRMDITIITMKRWPGTTYFPSLVEIMVSIGIVAGLMLVFMYFVENLEVFHEPMKLGEKRDLETAEETLAAAAGKPIPPRGVVTGTVQKYLERWFLNREPFEKPELSPSTKTWFGDPWEGGIRQYSMMLVLAIALTAAILPSSAIFGFRADDTPVRPAKVDIAGQGDILRIDGNLAHEAVLFNHQAHQERTGGKNGCLKCHHMSVPHDLASPCTACHKDMFKPTSAFNHEFHQDYYRGNEGCVQCHPVDKNPENAKSCQACHREMWPNVPESARVNYITVSYQDALHKTCITCHEQNAARVGKPELPLCTTCHPHQ